jgi:hypothetical protein
MNLNLTYLNDEKLTYSLTLYKSIRQKLDDASKQTGVSAPNLVRHALNNLLDELEKEQRNVKTIS